MALNRYVFLFLLTALVALSSSASLPPVGKRGGAIPKEEIAQIHENPISLLTKFLDAGPPMADYISRAVITDPSVVDPILSIADKATPQQASAMGAGIARAARAIGIRQPKVVMAITQRVMQTENIQLKITFTAIGPSYAAYANFKLPDLIPFAPLSTYEVGVVLPGGGRLGIPEELRMEGKDIGGGNMPVIAGTNAAGVGAGVGILAQYATLVALLASDAPSNGAVSTSPTQ